MKLKIPNIYYRPSEKAKDVLRKEIKKRQKVDARISLNKLVDDLIIK